MTKFHLSQPRDGAPVTCDCELGYNHDAEGLTNVEKAIRAVGFARRQLDLTAEAAVTAIKAHPEHSPALHSLIGGLGSTHAALGEILHWLKEK